MSRKIADGEVIKVDGIAFKVLYTPGHTDDSCSVVMNDRVHPVR